MPQHKDFERVGEGFPCGEWSPCTILNRGGLWDLLCVVFCCRRKITWRATPFPEGESQAADVNSKIGYIPALLESPGLFNK